MQIKFLHTELPPRSNMSQTLSVSFIKLNTCFVLILFFYHNHLKLSIVDEIEYTMLIIVEEIGNRLSKVGYGKDHLTKVMK